jgi:ectoine hydroxylase-related dioxygenase (phytanoyl-CoA dioxygenase family)
MNVAMEHDGFAVSKRFLSPAGLQYMKDALKPLSSTADAGIRDLAAKVHAVKELTQSVLMRDLVEAILGEEAQLVRSVLFTKSLETNWVVPWHQDLTIAVAARHEVSGYTGWSLKEGVHHVQPPLEILEKMLTVRVHLDAADETNGALWVSPGSHRLGRIPASEVAAAAERDGKHLCAVNAGDALFLRPLLLHGSRKATSNWPRRVIHLEFASVPLPPPLVWASG